MGLRDLKALVASCHGLPGDTRLDGRAARLTVGDVRLLLECADAVIGEARGPRPWMAMLNYAATDEDQRTE